MLFNRFLQPDIDPEQLAVLPKGRTSRADADARLACTWIALLRGRARASLAATSGLEVPADLARYLLAGADVVMTTSPSCATDPSTRLSCSTASTSWMARKGFDSVDEVRGMLSVPAVADGAAYERPAT